MLSCAVIGDAGSKPERGNFYMERDLIRSVLYLQASIAKLYMKKHGVSVKEFLEIDKKFDILGFLKIGYEPFHLTGDMGVLNEVEEYIAMRRQNK
jgi:hypothetical protein